MKKKIICKSIFLHKDMYTHPIFILNLGGGQKLINQIIYLFLKQANHSQLLCLELESQ